MKEYQFKTNINCSGCIEKVKPHLDAESGIEEWTVETTNPNKILKVKTENLDETQVKKIVQNAGFRIEKLA